jgi:hypothetical protein
MRFRHIPLFATAVVFSIAILAGTSAICGAKTSAPKTVTLAARRIVKGKDNYTSAAFSFRYGVTGNKGLSRTRNDWDLLFGNSPSSDDFTVSVAADDCSRIKDLGELAWTDKFKVPELPAYSHPTREPDIPAIVGHLYLVHNKNSNYDHYSLFRVESLDPGKSVTISWELVKNVKGIEIGRQDWYDPTFEIHPNRIRP